MSAIEKLKRYEEAYRKFKEHQLQHAKFNTLAFNKPTAPVPAHYMITTLAEVFMAESIREKVDKELKHE